MPEDRNALTCGAPGVCHLPAGHSGLCVFRPADLRPLERELARTLALLSDEILKRQAAEAILKAFLEGTVILVPTSS